MHRYSNFTWPMRRLPERRRAVAIYGPTSSGKTALSLEVCEAGHIWAYSSWRGAQGQAEARKGPLSAVTAGCVPLVAMLIPGPVIALG